MIRKYVVFGSQKVRKLGNSLAELFGDQSGSVAVITALSMVMLLGFSALVLDLGVSHNQASRLQNALDSAVLAAVRELPANNLFSAGWAAAKSEAIHYAAANNIDLDPGDLEPVYQDNLTANCIVGMRITKSIEVEYNFAKVLGISSGILSRTAAAGLTPAGAVTGAIPLSISASGLQAAIDAGAVSGLTVKCSSNANEIGIDCTGLSGWFGALRFEGTGASVYSDLLAYGYSGVLRVGQELDIESGNMSGPTMEGFTTRYDACTHDCTIDCHEPNCPRLVYIPVVEVLSSKRVKVVSFAPFFLLECGGSGNDSYIKATYLNDVVLPAAASGTSGQDFGLYVSKLLS